MSSEIHENLFIIFSNHANLQTDRETDKQLFTIYVGLLHFF